tara:strand:- start:6304 stop:6897 length:594 start_codon:yes stop_codon:yes gene_type:complete
MKIKNLKIPGVYLIEPNIFKDDRGFFLETYRKDILDKFGIKEFLQQNQSRSIRGVLRGLHYQQVDPQGKLVRCSRGEIFDVAVDIRKGSRFFGQWIGEILNDINHYQLWIPPGFAHGFLVLSELADVCYSCTKYYSPEKERGIKWNDEDLKINWPISKINTELILSKKDMGLKSLKDQIGYLPNFKEFKTLDNSSLQ